MNELKQQIEQQVNDQIQQQLISQLIPKCFNSCILKPGGKLSYQEEDCLESCAKKFHADEALAIYMLKKLPEYSTAQIVRTRDPLVISQCDIVVDVGGKYDPSKHLYDHHQREFNHTWSPLHSIKLSSAGLVYKHFGDRAIASTLNWSLDNPSLPLVVSAVYEKLIQGFDGVDNGINRYQGEPLYEENTSIAARVARLNPDWNQPVNDDLLFSRFLEAIELTGKEFDYFVENVANSWLPGRELVKQSLLNAKSIHSSGKVMLLEKYCPWKSHLHALEKELGVEQVLYVVYRDSGDTSWRVQAVPTHPNSFESRKALPSDWRGLRDEQLSTIAGIPECVFVHATGFIGGNKTKEGALSMAFKGCQF